MTKIILNLFILSLFFASSAFTQVPEPIFETQISNSLPPMEADNSSSTQPLPKPAKNYFDIKGDNKEGDRFLSEFINMMTTLGLIIVIILIATWFLKKMVSSRIQQLNTSSLIKIIERRTLSPKTSLILVDIQGAGYVFAESTNGVTALGNFDPNTIEKQEQSSSFEDVMKNQ